MREAAPSAAIHTVFEVAEDGLVRAIETLSEEVGLSDGLETVQEGDRLFEGSPLASRIGHYASRARTLGQPLRFDRHHWSPKGLFHFEIGVWPKAEGGFSVAVSPLAGAETQLRRAALHRDIVEHANDAIMVCEGEPIDSPGPRILFVNPAFERLTGYSASEVVGCSPRLLQGPRTARAALDRVRTALREQRGVGVELLNYRKDGGVYWAELRLEPVRDEAGWLTHWIGVQRDVTARREGERWLQLLISGLDQVQKCLLLTEGEVGGEGPRIAFANATAAQVLGASEAELVGRSLATLWAPGSEAEAATLAEAMRGGAVADGAIRCRRGATGTFWLNWHLGLPIRSEAGGPPHFLLIAHDSTQERQTAAERLRTARSETLAALARGVVHNFNNKLAGVIGALSLARLKVAEGDLSMLEPLIRQADESAGEAAAVATQLQVFARGESVGRTVVPLAPLLREVVAFSLQGSSIVAEFHLDPAAPAVLAEPTSLQQCLAALAVNARQALPGPGRLIVRLEGTELAAGEAPGLAAGPYARISLQDNGTTRPHAELERLLELELPAVPDSREFGLAAASAFAREHRGSLVAQPLPERGTVFTLLLPAAPTPASAPPTPLVGGRGRILVLDDEAGLRQNFIRLAAEAGYEATAVASPGELLGLYEESLRADRRFEAVVVDLTSPGGEGGLGVLRRLLELDPQARVIVSSGYAEPPEATGAVAFLRKPYRVEDLAQVLARALQADSPSAHAVV
ncbi:MAG: PAS domain-containing protein [Verrucomicrobia bacterium]|nr:PAS domain-containing protein [Verrucomicrobiota bacterium]